MATSKDQVARLLAMVPYLQAHPGVSVSAVAEVFGISPAQVIKDLKVLWMCGTPGGFPDDLIEIDMDAAREEGVIHLTNAEYLARPLRFTASEAMSLVVALQAIREMATGELLEAASSATDKLIGLGIEAPVVLQVTSGDATVRERLVQAIDAQRSVRLTYDGALRSATTTPVVDPVVIVMRDSVAYLQAWAHEPDAERTYRLDRISAVEILDQPARPHPVPAPGDRWFDGVPDEVTLHLAPGAAWVPEYVPVREHHAEADGTLRVRLAVADPAWLEGLLLRLGSDVLAVDPPRTAEAARANARELLEMYRSQSSDES